MEHWVLNLVFFYDLLEFSCPVHLVVLFKYSRSEVFIILVHDTGLMEVLLEVFKSLNACILNVTLLLGVKHGPLSALKFFIEVQNHIVMNEVHKGVPYIGRVIIVNRKVEEVILPLMVFIDFL